MNKDRMKFLYAGLAQLPDIDLSEAGRNGEELATDEAAVWKRVLNYRVCSWLKPDRILETHPGLGISTRLYRHAHPAAEIVALDHWQNSSTLGRTFTLIDIDPFGQPWDVLDACVPWLCHPRQAVVMVSNGEALAVWRNLRRSQRYPTANYGKRLPRWVLDEYLPRLEQVTRMTVSFFYAFPTSIRSILSYKPLPSSLWDGCRQWQWWLKNYVD